MSYNQQTSHNPAPLSYPEICSAVSGDPEGMQRVLNHYHRYLYSLARCTAHGKPDDRSWIDEELLMTLENILLEKILSFEIK